MASQRCVMRCGGCRSNNDGMGWHRHPHSAPESHDFSDEGTRPASLVEFLDEVQQILIGEGIL